MATKTVRVPKEHTYSENALKNLALEAQRKAAKAKAKRKAEREAKRLAKLNEPQVIKDDQCAVCQTPTRNFNARINIPMTSGRLMAIGICGKCVRRGYTFDKEANIIHRERNAT